MPSRTSPGIPNNRYHRVAVHLEPVNGGQPYGQLTVKVVKEYQDGEHDGKPDAWSDTAQDTRQQRRHGDADLHRRRLDDGRLSATSSRRDPTPTSTWGS